MSVGAAEPLVAVLRSIELFRACTPEGLGVLARACEVLVAPAGEYVYRQGEPADSMAVVRSGRLEICFESADAEETIATRVGPGGVIGELALLVDTPRSASVRAVRDSELLTIDRDSFQEVLASEPAVALAVARDLGARLQVSVDAVTRSPSSSVLAFVPLERDLPIPRVVDACRSELLRYGTVACLDETSEQPYSRALDLAEEGADFTLLVARGDADEEWVRFCVGSADRVAVFVSSRAGREFGDRWAGHDLVFLDGPPTPSRLRATIDAIRPRAHHTIRSGSKFGADVRRLTRRISDRAISLVLSGGGARGFAHLGVVDRLLAAGIEIDAVGGCSMGAFVGAMVGQELEPERMIATCRAEFVARRPFNDYTVPRISLIRARKARAMLTRVFAAVTLEELPRPTFVVSADLESGDLVAHARGPLREAVGASMSIPGLAPPVCLDGRLLVDGGLIDNLPVAEMREREPGRVIAVDVMRYYEPSRVGNSLPSIVETVTRATFLGSRRRAVGSRQQADVLIAPAVNDISLLQFDRLEHAVAAGRRAADAALGQGLDRVLTGRASSQFAP
jgi:NTE family protein